MICRASIGTMLPQVPFVQYSLLYLCVKQDVIVQWHVSVLHNKQAAHIPQGSVCFVTCLGKIAYKYA